MRQLNWRIYIITTATMNKVYLKLNKEVKVAFYNQSAILLDLKDDRFRLLDSEYSNLFKTLLTHSFNKTQAEYAPSIPGDFSREFVEKINIAINELRQCDILDKNDYTNPSIITIVNSEGVANLEWRLPQSKPVKTSLPQTLHIYLQLLITHYLLTFRGLNSLIARSKLMHKKYRSKNSGLNNNYLERLSILVNMLDKICIFFPLQTKCLAWAATCHRLALFWGIECNLIIGVQAFPFMSHAWIEYNSCIISDDENLAKQLAIILRVPDLE